MTHKFEEYSELSEMMQEYACFGSFSNWQKFTDALNNALIKAENLPIHNVVGRYSQQEIEEAYDKGREDGYACMPTNI